MAAIAKFTGLRNDVSHERFRAGDMEEATNVYLDDSGRVSRRDGLTQVVAGSSHSLWSNGNLCLFGQGQALLRLLPDGGTESVNTGLSGQPLSYYQVMDSLYYSDSVVARKYANGLDSQWGMTPPGLVSVASTVGTLPAGRYGYTATFIDSDGLESGAVNFGVIELGANAGITFTAPDTDYAYVAFYMTPTDGDMYYRVGFATSGNTLTVTELTGLINPLVGVNAGPAPAGQIVSHYRGHMLVANGQWLHYSYPYAYHLFDPLAYIPLEERITIVAPVKDGVFIATTEQTYFVSGSNPGDFMLNRKVANYGAIEGSLVRAHTNDFPWLEGIEEQDLAIWASSEGICVAGNSGLFINVTNSRYMFGAVTTKGASIITQMGATKQLITSIE